MYQNTIGLPLLSQCIFGEYINFIEKSYVFFVGKKNTKFFNKIYGYFNLFLNLLLTLSITVMQIASLQ